jgi:hypothetical protein
MGAAFAFRFTGASLKTERDSTEQKQKFAPRALGKTVENFRKIAAPRMRTCVRQRR